MSSATRPAEPQQALEAAFANTRFDNRYARLPARFYARQEPARVAQPRLIRLNEPLAAALGIHAQALDARTAAELFAGNRLPSGAEPLAQAYAGHQFGHFVPQLGDGRAIVLGEVIDRNGARRDIQLKGSGRTPYSRQGDGRAPLGPVIREYIISEAMHALGVPTTRSLAMVATGEPVMRETALPGAVLTRVAASHVRVGTFEYFAAQSDTEAVRMLADYVIARHYPQLGEAANPYHALLEAVVARQAALVAHWMQIGFIHGVMNTDNTAIAGETIDYGPCAFMDRYDPATVFSSIDRFGRYAYGNQPPIMQWNLVRFAETLLPLLDENSERAVAVAEAAINRFPKDFERAWLDGMRRKFGLADEQPGDDALIHDLLARMQAQQADFTLTFRALCDAADGQEAALAPYIGSDEPARDWLARWLARRAQAGEHAADGDAMRRVNPAYIPRNHRVEQAIEAAVEHDDFGPMDSLLTVVTDPFTERVDYSDYSQPPAPQERVYQTFCGT